MLVFGVYIFYIQTINGFHVNLENIFEVIYTTSSIELMSPPMAILKNVSPSSLIR